MFRKTCPCVAALVLFLALPGAAQQTQTIGRAEAQKALVHKVEPTYPAIALAAQITGQVVLEVNIGVDGKVTKTTVVYGPPMLRQAAVDAVSQWEYAPFQVNGRATTAVAEVALDFTLANPEPAGNAGIAAKYFPASDECHRDMASAGANPEATARACNLAAAFADMFEPGTRFIERRSAYVFAAAALLRLHKYPEAEAMARKGVAVVKEGHDDDGGRSAAYAILGNAEGMLGNLEAADVDMKTAETYEHAALANATGAFEPAESRRTLKTILLFHADLLDRMQRPLEAKARRDEAAAL